MTGEQVKAEVRSAVAAPAIIGGGQLLIGLIVLGVGVAYDWWKLEPGPITLAALGMIGGPGFLLTLLRARALQAGRVVPFHARLKEPNDER